MLPPPLLIPPLSIHSFIHPSTYHDLFLLSQTAVGTEIIVIIIIIICCSSLRVKTREPSQKFVEDGLASRGMFVVAALVLLSPFYFFFLIPFRTVPYLKLRD